mmetsp:Transcript_44666/g.115595  ORF Transcript_44666/g.115595 Transcript_44666/m.115595 type:complete len:222 (-) Transcript_44666:203-868(-)
MYCDPTDSASSAIPAASTAFLASWAILSASSAIRAAASNLAASSASRASSASLAASSACSSSLFASALRASSASSRACSSASRASSAFRFASASAAACSSAARMASAAGSRPWITISNSPKSTSSWMSANRPMNRPSTCSCGSPRSPPLTRIISCLACWSSDTSTSLYAIFLAARTKRRRSCSYFILVVAAMLEPYIVTLGAIRPSGYATARRLWSLGDAG